MAKDPAVLWYWNDWAGGTSTFSRHLKGCYIDLLHAQFNVGRLSISEIKTVLGVDFPQWEILKKKFTQDDSGNFYNERAEIEKQKRVDFSEKQRKNRLGKTKSTSLVKPFIENENENPVSIDYLIKIGNEKFFKKGSEILNDEYRSIMDDHMRGVLKGFDEQAIFDRFDIEYPRYDFRDRNHLSNSVKGLKDKILKEKNSGKKENGNTTSKSGKAIQGLNNILEQRGINQDDHIQNPPG